MSEITTKKVTTPFGDLVYYRTLEKKHEYNVIFIHGLGGSKEWFPDHYHMYSLDNFSWIVPDLMGYGNSAKPRKKHAYTMEQQATYLLQVLREEKVKSLVIIAHSMGGPIAISLIEQMQTKQKNQDQPWPIPICLFYLEGNLDKGDTFFSSQIARKSLEKYESGFQSWCDKLLGQTNEESLIDWVNYLRQIGPFPLWASSQDLVSVSVSNKLLPKLLKLINFPVFFVYGERNKGLFSSEKLILQASLPLIFLPDSGHTMLRDNPRALWRFIQEKLH